MANDNKTNGDTQKDAMPAAKVNGRTGAVNLAPAPTAKADGRTGTVSIANPAENPQKKRPKLSAEQIKLKNEEQARAARRRNRQLIGLALTVLVIVGAISIVLNGINLVQRMLDVNDQSDDYEARFEAMVWFDLLPFDSLAQVDENALKQVCIWALMNEQSDTLARNEYGEPLIPSIEVDQYALRLFGADFRFSGHETFADPVQGLRYTYDEATGVYTAPSTGLMPEYLANVVEVRNEPGGVRRVVMGYVSTRTSDDRVLASPDFSNNAKYNDFMLRRSGNEYYLYAIERNTTYETAVSSSPQPAQEQDGSSVSEAPA